MPGQKTLLQIRDGRVLTLELPKELEKLAPGEYDTELKPVPEH